VSENKLLDKFYTPIKTAKMCIDIAIRNIGDISEIIEPSAGDGSFSRQIDGCIAYDIEPHHDSIIKQDFLLLDSEYKKGRLIIGNPPFGNRNNMALKFFKKSIVLGDCVAFILPISQYENTDSFYEFDLIKSVDLGELKYSGIVVRCCFNVYKRPSNGLLNKKEKLSSDLFSLHRTNRDNFENTVADFIFCKRGSVGKEVFLDGKRYSDEYKVVVYDKNNLDYVRNVILNHDWNNFKTHQSSPNISKNDIYRLFIAR